MDSSSNSDRNDTTDGAGYDATSMRRERKLLKLAASDATTPWSKTRALPQARVFYPTVDEFADPVQYIARYDLLDIISSLYLRAMDWLTD